MDKTRIEEILIERKEPTFRLKQIKKAIFFDGVESFSQISTLPKDLREQLESEVPFWSFELKKVLASSDGQSIKALLKLQDGNFLETVLIAPKPQEWSACVSSQVGCPMGCAFCATGKQGLKRNLTTEEITDQVLFWRHYLKKEKIDGSFNHLVFMGMGEPFLNWENVQESLNDFIDPEMFAIGSRNISVSTCGILEKIDDFAKKFPQVNLAISLHFADDKKRDQYMPVNRKYPLESLNKALQQYFTLTKRKVFLEYVMLSGVNDGREDADNLEKFIISTGWKKLLHVNLICYNETGSVFKSSSREQTEKFKDYLSQKGVSVTIRKSLGQDIQSACGQLAGKG